MIYPKKIYEVVLGAITNVKSGENKVFKVRVQ